jgi:hypothetical protein
MAGYAIDEPSANRGRNLQVSNALQSRLTLEKPKTALHPTSRAVAHYIATSSQSANPFNVALGTRTWSSTGGCLIDKSRRCSVVGNAMEIERERTGGVEDGN